MVLILYGKNQVKQWDFKTFPCANFNNGSVRILGTGEMFLSSVISGKYFSEISIDFFLKSTPKNACGNVCRLPAILSRLKRPHGWYTTYGSCMRHFNRWRINYAEQACHVNTWVHLSPSCIIYNPIAKTFLSRSTIEIYSYGSPFVLCPGLLQLDFTHFRQVYLSDWHRANVSPTSAG